jgi:UDP-glucose 4-epimerase
MKICVTGGAGFVGVHLIRRLLAEGAEILAVDDFSASDPSRIPADPQVHVERIDVRDAEQMVKALETFRPAALIHLAARHFIPYCDAHPLETMDVNVKGTVAVLRSASTQSRTHVLLASSLAVYPPSTGLLAEDDPLGPVDIYGYSKWMAELVCQHVHRARGSRISILRIANVYGAQETNPHVLPRIVAQVRHGDLVELGNLESRRDYIHVQDVAEAFVALVDPARPDARQLEIFNLSTGKDASVRELIAHIESILGRTIAVHSSRDLMRSVDRPVLRADPSRLCAATGWLPRLSLREGLWELLASEGLAERC